MTNGIVYSRGGLCMLVYINNQDLRGKALVSLYEEAGKGVTTLRSKIGEVDLSYLGLRGDSYEKEHFRAGSRVYTLIYNATLAAHCKQSNVHYDYLYDDDDLVEGNTYLTTEALIGYMVMDNPISIVHSTILVIGFGNCGKDIAKKLKALQANIHVTNRGMHYQNAVIEHGYHFVSLDTLDLRNYDFVINTVPHPLVSKEIINTKKTSCKIYDLASFPYGLKEEDRCDNYYILGSLPAKYAYKSAAKLIYKAIIKKEEIYVKK